LTLKRSILTEKISRRGYHLSREYGLDPLEILFVREVMRTNVVVLPGDGTLEQARELIRPEQRPTGQHLFPVVGANNVLLGVVTRNQMLKLFQETEAAAGIIQLADIATRNPVVAFEDEPLRVVVYRMAETGFTRFPVLDTHTDRLVGMVSLNDLLRARTRSLEDERERVRVLRIRMPFGRQTTSDKEVLNQSSDVERKSR
jgi:CBS domain-containing protein